MSDYNQKESEDEDTATNNTDKGPSQEKEDLLNNLHTESKKEDNGSLIICPSCRKENPRTNRFCNFCGYRFGERVKCLNCGNEPILNPFCSFCGAPLMVTQRTTRSGLPSSQQPQQASTSYSTQYYYPSEEERRESRLKSFNTLGTVAGILLIMGAIGLVGILFTILFVALKDMFLEKPEGWGSVFGFLIALFLVPAVLALVSGVAVIKHRPDNNAWKGFYHSLRYCFLAFSILLIAISLLLVISWTGYISNNSIQEALPFWFFTIVDIRVNTSLIGLWIIESLIFLVCIGLLATPKIISSVKSRRGEVDNRDKDFLETDSQPQTEAKDNGTITEQPFEEKLGFSLEIDKEKMRKIEISKGRLPDLFYHIKNNELIQAQELCALSFFASVVLIFRLFLSLEGYESVLVKETTPSFAMISLGWASIVEEISFRIILIGIPMIFVVLTRFFLESRKIQQKDRLHKWWDIPLAIRGKYKQIGIPELVLIGISSILFGFAHWWGWTGGWPFWKVFEAGLSGIFFGYAFVKYGIEGSILMHFGTNIMIGLTTYASEVGVEWISGFAAFFVVSIIALGFMKLVSIGITGIFWFKIYNEEKIRISR